ncbi:ABC transporter permease subunit [Anoxybacterium hadale]|uniref:ABC transporter permease subunit n=1 Tax=Anoxybacterium hadale TaxID=3408580 RepID=A0ACD1A6N6_9FIRM|nr:ABC transporter permease subunit [Clostridiales bacterium]
MKNSISNRWAIALISIYLILPIVFTFLYSIFAEWNTVLPKGLTFKYYMQVLSSPIFLMALIRTLIMAVLPIFLCAIVILLAMYVVIVYLPKLDPIIQILCTIPYALQGVIIAISVLSLYADAPDPFSNRLLMLTGTYCILILPYMYQGIRNSLHAVNARGLLEAAQILGAGRFYSYFTVIVPNILSGITISALISAAIIFGDFVVVNIIGGNYYVTAQIFLYKSMFQSGQLTSAVSIVLFTVTLLLAAGVWIMQNKMEKQKEAKA